MLQNKTCAALPAPRLAARIVTGLELTVLFGNACVVMTAVCMMVRAIAQLP